MRKLPQNTIWNQNNRSDRLGDLWSSYNLDPYSNMGSLRVSTRFILNVNSSTLANLGVPAAFRFFTTSSADTWAMAGARMFVADSGGPNTTFAEDATSGTPTTGSSDASDMGQLGTNLFVTGASTTVKYLDSTGAWNSATGTLTNSSGLHQITFLRAQNRLYVVDGNATGVSSISGTTITASSTYSLQSLVDGTYNKISWIKASRDLIYIGTINLTGGQSFVYVWDGSQNSGPNDAYVLDAAGSLACVIKDDVPVIVDTRGRLLQLNGGTFVELARLPFENQSPKTYFANATERLVHYNGMCLNDGKINILFNTQLYDTNSTNKENIPSGIWEYTEQTGLYHKASLGLSTAGGTITDYGAQKIALTGAIFQIEAPSNSFTQGSVNGRILAGARYYTDATATAYGIFYDDTADTLQKAGYLVTTKIYSSNLTDIWQKVSLRLKKLLNSNDKIVVKYRTAETVPQEISITWTSTTTFTTTTNIIGLEKYEVEVLQGVGSGKCSHITATSYNGSVYTATVDETYTGATGTAKARVQNWIKAGVTTSQTEDFHDFKIDKKSTWIQFKVTMIFTGKDEINDLFLIDTAHQQTK